MTKIRRSPGSKDSKCAIRIFTEGENTEPEYIEYFRDKLRISEELITVEKSFHTDLGGLLEEAIEAKRSNQRSAKRNRSILVDYWCIVVDTESMKIDTEDIDKAKKNGILVFFSDPCFEFWLILHFLYTTRQFNNPKEVSEYLDHNFLSGYCKCGKVPNMVLFEDKVKDAVSNSKKVRENHTYRGFISPRTDMDILIRIINSISEERSKLFDRESIGNLISELDNTHEIVRGN